MEESSRRSAAKKKPIEPELADLPELKAPPGSIPGESPYVVNNNFFDLSGATLPALRSLLEAGDLAVADRGSKIGRVNQRGVIDALVGLKNVASARNGVDMEFELSTVVANAMVVMGPYLPVLAGVGRKVAEGAANKVGESAFSAAQRLWSKVGKRLLERPGSRDAIEVLDRTPGDEDAKGALRMQLRALLAADDALAREVYGLLQESAVQEVVLLRSHAGNIVQESLGGPVKNSVHITDGSAKDITQRKT
ncbi:hypothetical protein QEG98_28215 [Myxococcus sp. MxC21-1]|uniref:hypothetical protein n=1 Tax=Myxococcus sp. MxC21-1 TaxID=3041439 RepID=UPI0029303AF1|nr:hypothetical protein [Myxococcus sp. MxC21-1]WNZ59891.1 hypothetical protein QEG98_28215 [Myxococcus sp. MxC21-1]